jgi:hypothetical protein
LTHAFRIIRYIRSRQRRFKPPLCSQTTARSAEMDLAFIALTIVLALLTLGLGRLCAKLLGGRQ